MTMDSKVGSALGQSTPQALYSERGRDAAKQTIARAAQEGSDEKKRQILYDGIDTITKDPGTTCDEKLIATFAGSISGKSISDRDLVLVRSLALDAIAKAVPGTTGAVLAKIALESTDSLHDDETARAVLYEALDCTAKNKNVPEKEKKISEFANSISGNSIKNRDVVVIRKAAAAAIASNTAEPASATITRIALDCCQHLSSKDSARSLLYSNLETFKKDPGASEFENKLAAFGNGITSDKMSGSDIVTLRALTLKNIQQNQTGAVRLPEAVSSIIMETLPSMSGSGATRGLLYDTFSQISKMDGLLPSEAALSFFGKEISGDSMTDSDVAFARTTILKAMVEHRNEEPARLLTRSALDSVSGIRSEAGKRQFLYHALETISKSPHCDTEMKQTAIKGLNASGSTDNAIVKARVRVLEELCEYKTPKERAREEIQQMSDNLQHGDSSASVEIEDDYVTINGLKLKKNREKSVGNTELNQ